jgi:hypothetical protein
MQTFVLMTKLAPEMSKQVKDQEKLGRVWFYRPLCLTWTL